MALAKSHQGENRQVACPSEDGPRGRDNNWVSRHGGRGTLTETKGTKANERRG
jgi:hypothetical protein